MSLAWVVLAADVRVQFIEGKKRALTTRTPKGVVPERSGIPWDFEPCTEVEVLGQEVFLHILWPSKRVIIAMHGVVLNLP